MKTNTSMSLGFSKKALSSLGMVLVLSSPADAAVAEEDPIPITKAEWIATGMPGAAAGETPPVGMPGVHVWRGTPTPPGQQGPMPVFRKSFPLDDAAVSRAQVAVCGLGHFELTVNGEKVGGHFLDPPWSDYADTCYYVKQVVTVLGTLMLALPARADQPAVLVEAEAFKNIGGWVNDSQFMDQMGSPFLLAHGLGRPVEDAETTAQMPSPGKYRVWVRTRDWVAQWTKGRIDAPGKFQVFINDKPLETVFGTKGVDWHWQDGGVVQLDKKEVSLKLHDLTGFEGRCDAVLLSSDLDYAPPDDAPAPWRRKLLGLPEAPVLKGDYELVVVGGGIAGVTACLSAARLGVKVALIHDRPVTGGASSAESTVGVAGNTCFEPYPRVGSLTNEIVWTYGKTGLAKGFALGRAENK